MAAICSSDMPLSIIDVVLRHREPLLLGGPLPIGLVAPIVYQPYPGDDREQVFAFGADGGGRLLAWREESEPEFPARTRFLVLPLEPNAWRDLLDGQISVRTVLAEAGAGLRVTLSGRVEVGGGVAVDPIQIRDVLPEDQLPPEQVVDDAGRTKPSRTAWLRLAPGRVVTADNPDHAEELSDLVHRSPDATASTADGATVAAYGLYVVTDSNGDRTFRVHARQTDARLAVERAGLG